MTDPASSGGSPARALGALVVVVALPGPLEEIRRSEVAVAAQGFPAHVTILYPFAPPEAVPIATRRDLAALVAAVPAFPLTIGPTLGWADVTALAVAPPGPFRALIEQIAGAFPSFPPYEGRIPVAEIVPHVTIAERLVALPGSSPEATFDAGVVDHVSWFGGRHDEWDPPIELPLG